MARRQREREMDRSFESFQIRIDKHRRDREDVLISPRVLAEAAATQLPKVKSRVPPEDVIGILTAVRGLKHGQHYIGVTVENPLR